MDPVTASSVAAPNAVAAAGTQAAGNIISTYMTNKASAKQQRLANAYNYLMWQAENEYNKPVNQMKRFAEAGLNPNLIYGQGTAGNAGSVPQAVTADKRYDVGASLGNAFQTYAALKSLQKDTELKDAQIRMLESKGDTESAKRASMFLDNVRKGQMLNDRLKTAVANRQVTYAQAARIRQLIATTEGVASLEANLKKEKLNDMLLQRMYGENPLSVKNLPAGPRQAAGVFEKLFTILFGLYYNLPRGEDAPDEIM